MVHPLLLTRARRADSISAIKVIIAVVVVIPALLATFIVAAPQVAAQVVVQPEGQADDSRDWDVTIPMAPGEPIVANPALPDKCGLDIAFVFDLSTSIGEDGLAQTKEAGTAVVKALNSTPTQIGIYNFGTHAPARAAEDAEIGRQDPGSQDALVGVIDKLKLPDGQSTVGTNWDRGIAQIPQDKTYDVVYFITDGLPTVFGEAKSSRGERGLYNRPLYNHANNGKANKDFAAAQADVQRAVQSANRLKESGTRIVPLAVGDAVNNDPVAKPYLSYISGEHDWIPVADYDALARTLVQQATENCRGEVNLTKQLVDEEGNPVEGDVSGYRFTANAASGGIGLLRDGLNPAESVSATTTSEGRSRFPYVTSTDETQGSFAITEDGDSLQNVECTEDGGGKVDAEINGQTFKVPAATGLVVNCVVSNKVEVPPTEPSEPTTVTTTVEVPTTVTVTETVTATEPVPTTETATVTETVPTTETATVTETVPTTETVTATETSSATATETETVEVPTTVTTTETVSVSETLTTTESVPTTETVTVTETEPTTVTTTVEPQCPDCQKPPISSEPTTVGSSGDTPRGSSNERCISAVAAVAAPLALLVPLAVLQQVSLPGLDGYFAEINARLTAANSELQSGLGIYDEQVANAAAQFDAQVQQWTGQNKDLIGLVGGAVAFLAAVGFLYANCVPEGDASSLSSE